MKALLCDSIGEDAALRVGDVPAPSPGPGTVRIRVSACGVNFPDVLLLAGQYQYRPDLPFAPGGEVAGIVAELGEGVSGLRVGQRVAALVGVGGMAAEVVAPAAATVALPDSVDDIHGAAFLFTYGTALHALRDRARLADGETLLVLGAAGGVGLATVELGAAMGARVLAAASTKEKLELARVHGADALIDYSSTELRDAVKALTGGRGADVILDPVGGDAFEQGLRCIAWNGRILVVGFASGTIPRVPANLALLKGCSIVGVFWGRFCQEDPVTSARNHAELAWMLDGGTIRPHVSATYPLERGDEAIAQLAKRRALGKIVVTLI